MKILYSVQATGNGHISRARDVIPELQKHGQVDLFLSGSNAHLDPGFEVKYRSKGLSLFYNSHGGLDYMAILNNLNLARIYKEARQLPVEKYDLVINDYECITALACSFKRKQSTQFGHQASYHSKQVPRPEKKNLIGELVLQRYATATHYVGLHFWPYDKDIYTPILRKEILNATPEDRGHVTVYLSQYSAENITKHLLQFKEVPFDVFTGDVKKPEKHGNIQLLPISREGFTQSMVNSRGVITGAGFETPAEAMILGKKLIVIPIQAQYEQLCNAEALREWNVPVLKDLQSITADTFRQWYGEHEPRKFHLLFSTEEIVSKVVTSALSA